MSHYSGRAMRRVCVTAHRLFSFSLLAVVVLMSRSAEAQSLPSGWSASNIGSPAIAGRVAYDGNMFTVEGGGTRIGSTSDQFYFVHQRVTGNVTIVARVGSLERTADLAKAGVMIRESLAANSRHASAVVMARGEVGFHRRTKTGGTTSGTNVSGSTPVWLRLVRSGSTFTASYSSNGTSWTTIRSVSISMASTVYVGLAVASYNSSALATATFSNVSGTATGALPSGWTGADVGSPSIAGSSTYSNGTFSVAGAGVDIWGTSDQFRFVYRQVSGDVDIVARVTSLLGVTGWSKAGVMVRASLAANSAHASMLLTYGNGLAFQRRPATGYYSLHTSGGSGTAPVWVKLERRGSSITAYRSATGTSWSLIGSETLTLPSTFYVGLAVTSQSSSAVATGQFTDVAVQAPSSVGMPPWVSLTSPAAGATFTAPATINIAADATDGDGIASVEFYANGTRLGADTTSPYTFTWSSVPAGSYSIAAVARDTSGASTTSAAHAITVSSGTSNSPPAVSLTAPVSGATYVAPASVTLAASASDTDGTIARVDFYAGSTLLGSDTTSPYSVTWTNAPAGAYSLTAVARDNAGAATTSAARSITIAAAQIPTTAIFEPSPDHATVARYVLDIFTAGANPSTSTPVATRDLGKPAILNGECTVDVSATILGLPSGNYFATVVAVSSGGTSTRAVSGTFTR